ncbi:hypothetical protein PFISCL1PPCAC_22010, partial [Pristionchus fissidentatus]
LATHARHITGKLIVVSAQRVARFCQFRRISEHSQRGQWVDGAAEKAQWTVGLAGYGTLVSVQASIAKNVHESRWLAPLS